jgi:hypothetical protein
MTTAPLTGQALRVGYQFSTGASGNADTVDGIHASATPTANTIVPLNANAEFPFAVIGKTSLNAIESTDFIIGTALSAATWTDFKANQNFTVTSTNSLIIISIIGVASIGAMSSANYVSSRIVIDSAGTPINRNVGGTSINNLSGGYANPFTGAGLIILTGLSVGVHTIKTQVLCSGTGSAVYCRASSIPNQEFFATQIIEIGG